jgi:hypothetical protein
MTRGFPCRGAGQEPPFEVKYNDRGTGCNEARGRSVL